MHSHEPYWHTNTSFSPPPSRWDIQLQSEEQPYTLHDVAQLHGSSTLSDEKDSWGRMRGNLLCDLHYSASDGTGPSLSTSSDLSQGPLRTPPAIQEISIHDLETATRKDPSLAQMSFTPTKEGTSENPDSVGSTSSQSESSESEFTAKSHLSSQGNLSSRRSFISKPIHPLSFPDLTPTREAFDPTVSVFSEVEASTALRDSEQWSNASSSLDSADVSESFETETPAGSHIHSDGLRCSLCGRFLSHRSPWSSRRIVRSVDMPITGVLPCHHIFHAECLDQTTPKTWKNDPPCPLCILSEESSPDKQGISRLRNGFLRLRPFCEDGDGPSRPWGCTQARDCVEGALHAPPCNAMFLLNRNRIKKNLSSKGNLSKEFPGKLRKSGPYPSLLFSGSSADQEAVSGSKDTASPSMKR